jgi:hypothetical protein
MKLKSSHSNLRTTFGTVLRQSNLSFCCLKITTSVHRQNKVLETNQCGSRSETLVFTLQICGLAICGLGHKGILQIAAPPWCLNSTNNGLINYIGTKTKCHLKLFNCKGTLRQLFTRV